MLKRLQILLSQLSHKDIEPITTKFLENDLRYCTCPHVRDVTLEERVIIPMFLYKKGVLLQPYQPIEVQQNQNPSLLPHPI